MAMQPKEKKRLIWSLVAFGVIAIFYIIGSSANKKASLDQEAINDSLDPAKRSSIAEPAKPVFVDTAKIIDNLKSEIAEMTNYVKTKKTYPEAITFINMIEGFNKKYDNYRYGGLAYDKYLPAYLKSVKSFAAYAYPAARRALQAELDHKFWQQNMKIKVSGGKAQTLTLVGAAFANNSNIESFQNDVSATLEKFRFKRVNYKWYDLQDEYTYYTIHSKEDNEI